MRHPRRTLFLMNLAAAQRIRHKHIDARVLTATVAALIFFIGSVETVAAQAVTLDRSIRAQIESVATVPVTMVPADKDAFLRPGNRNRNEGANPLLHLGESRRQVVGFDLRDIDLNGLVSATLVLTINDRNRPRNWGRNGRTVDAHALLEEWAEGNGRSFGLPPRRSTRGEGEGVTWRCGIDTAIENLRADCVNPPWNGGNFAAQATDQFLMTNGATGEATWDVTDDVLEGFDSWLIKKTQGNGNARFYSRDHPAVAQDFSLAPRLELTYVDPPPVAEAQEVFTDGENELEIILTGNDPDGGNLSFATSALAFPLRGTLTSPVPIIPPLAGRCSESGASCEVDPDCPGTQTCEDLQQPPITSATVTYTPDTDENLENSFTFTVTNEASEESDPATVAINPEGDPTPEPPALEDVVAEPEEVETGVNATLEILLTGTAPCEVVGSETEPCDGVGNDVDLTFSIVSNPVHGTLANLTQGTEVPQRTATVDYTPSLDFSGIDSLGFQVAGDTNGDGDTSDEGETATATVIINVFDPDPPEPDPDTVTLDDQTVQTEENAPVVVTVTAETSTSGSGALFQLAAKGAFPTGEHQPQAATLIGADIAGNVADANGDGFGDENNNLPGPAPVLMVAGVDLSGGAGTNGTVRMQIEWEIDGFDPNDLESAEVILHTSKGSTDILDIDFFAGGADQDGLLSEDDFEAPVIVDPESGAPVLLATMPVTPGQSTFEFDVLEQVKAALNAGQDYFSVQGRVDETEDGPARGLQVRTTADGNLNGSVCPAGLNSCEPMLLLTTPGIVTELVVLLNVTVLPQFGELIDENGRPISLTPVAPLRNGANLVYTPNRDFNGTDEFRVQADLVDLVSETTISTALATMTLNVGSASKAAVELLNHPNPFNPNTAISFALPEASEVKLVVYDVLGRQIRVLVDGRQEAGTHTVTFEAGDLPSGMYLYRLETPTGTFVKTMLLLK